MRCPLCEKTDGLSYFAEYKAKNAPFASTCLIRCEECSFIFIEPMPSEEALDAYYKNVWLTDDEVISSSPDSEKVYAIQAEERVKYLLRHIDLRAQKKFLDVGSGFGCYFDCLKKQMIGGEYFAQDPNRQNQKRLSDKGIKTYNDLKDIKDKDFDVVSVFCVLEHAADPKAFIRGMKDKLRTGGYIFIDIPERDDTHKQLFEPHVGFYDKESLSGLLKSCGLEILHAGGHGVKRDRMIESLRSRKGFGAFFKKASGKLWGCLKYWRKILKGEARFYRAYEYDSEGSDRWWLWAIAKKK